jgi:ketosteroid isomerase-like protein
MTRKARFAGAVGLMLATSIASAHQSSEVAQIHETHAAFIAAFNEGDLDRAFSYLTDDFVAIRTPDPAGA